MELRGGGEKAQGKFEKLFSTELQTKANANGFKLFLPQTPCLSRLCARYIGFDMENIFLPMENSKIVHGNRAPKKDAERLQ